MSSGVTQEKADARDIDPHEITQSDIETLQAAEQPDGDEGPDDGTDDGLTLDRRYELLKNQRRRRVLRFLLQNEEESTTGELAEHIAALENDKEDGDSVTSKERKASYVGLYQCHLPKMDDYGVISFNKARGRIALTERAYELEEYLFPGNERTWPLYYLTVTGIGGSLFAASVIVSGGLLTLAIAFGTYLSICLVALAQWTR